MLITLNELKDTGITGTDAYLTALITRVSAIVEKYVGRSLSGSASYTEEYDGNNTGMIVLRQYPVQAVTAVDMVTGDLGDPNYDAVNSDLYSIAGKDTNLGSPFGVLNLTGEVAGNDRYRITYTAGEVTVPETIKQAVIDLCGYYLSSAKSSGVKSETLGEYSITYGGNGNSTIKSLGLDFILDLYRTPSV